MVVIQSFEDEVLQVAPITDYDYLAPLSPFIWDDFKLKKANYSLPHISKFVLNVSLMVVIQLFEDEV